MDNRNAYRYYTRCCSALSGLRPGNQSDSSPPAVCRDCPRHAAGCRRAGVQVRRRVRQCFRPSRLYPLPAVRLCGADTLRADWPTMVPGQPDAVLAVFNRVIAVAQPAGFDYHGRERRRLAVAVVR
ncbi:hypothetical protein L1887_43901 [Cichorium endivia]|nr:hypothetical protein L1887_43901 [Cichorium endivia]